MGEAIYEIPIVDAITGQPVVAKVDKVTFDKLMTNSSRMDLLRQLKSTVEQLIALEEGEQ